MQFVYDNADFNIQIIGRYNTFHVKVRMYTVDSVFAVPPDATIVKLTNISAAEVVGGFGHLTFKQYEAKQGGDGLKEIKIKDLSSEL